MKCYRFLTTLFAAILVTSCSSDREDPATAVTQSLGERTYLTVRFTMSGADTRADGTYQNASTDELTVNRAYFYFFDKNFESCAGVKVLKSTDFESWNSGGNTVDKVSNPVIVLEDPKEVPAYVVAVLNSPHSENFAPATVEELRHTIYNYSAQTAGNFMMSNSAYLGADGKAVYATPLSADNLYTVALGQNVDANLSEILQNLTPVVIPVERALAQVNPTMGLTTATESGETLNGTPIKVEMKGWWVHNESPHSYLIKEIDTQWGYGGTWNDPGNLRSYWAQSAPVEKYGTHSYDEYVTSAICEQENTDAANPATLVVAAELTVDDALVELVRWRDLLYTAEGYLTQVSNELSGYYTLATDEDASAAVYRSLTASDLTLVANTTDEKIQVGEAAIKDYEVIPQIDETQVTTVYIGKEGAMEPLTDGIATVNTVLKTPSNVAQYWKGGRTYFYTPISHTTVPNKDITR